MKSPAAKRIAEKRAEMKRQKLVKRVYYMEPDKTDRADKYMLTRIKAIKGS